MQACFCWKGRKSHSLFPSAVAHHNNEGSAYKLDVTGCPVYPMLSLCGPSILFLPNSPWPWPPSLLTFTPDSLSAAPVERQIGTQYRSTSNRQQPLTEGGRTHRMPAALFSAGKTMHDRISCLFSPCKQSLRPPQNVPAWGCGGMNQLPSWDFTLNFSCLPSPPLPLHSSLAPPAFPISLSF